MSSRTANLFADQHPYDPIAQTPEPQPIGKFRNEWRQRTVYIYPHPTDADRVVTVGYPFDGGAYIVTDEPRSSYAQYIGSFNKVYR